VVYRFDDHRYLELKGWDCEGELWYTDTQRKFTLSLLPILSGIYTKICPFFRALHRDPNWEVDGFIVSKDYGQTWRSVSYSPGGMNRTG
jgi:hypothetical protein